MKPILEVENLEKYYGNRGNITKAVDNINFCVNEGEFVGIMGPSGSGKTTLLNCISTIDTVTSGHIRINDKDITTLKKDNLSKFRRNELGFIFQDFNLLDTLTAYENIALALTIQKVKTAEIEKRVHDAARKLDIMDTLEKYPYQLSGGQKQRLTIARALVRKPEILILDDSASALDFATDARLRKAIKENTDNMTVFLVSQRVSTIRNADHILVLDDGKIAGIGTHLQLLKENQVYKEICASQMAGEEA